MQDKQRQKQSWIWLGIAVVLMFISSGQWTMWIGPWLTPIFLMRFTRSRKPFSGYLLAVLGTYIAVAVTWCQILPLPLPVYLVFMLINAFTSTLPYLIDRLLSPHLKGLGATLIFPLAGTAFEFFYMTGSPLGSFGASAYTQYALLPLIQIISVTGMWSITFLLGWLAGVVNWAWERDFAWRRVWPGAATFGGVIAAIVIFGALRLSTAPEQEATVQVAGITAATINMEELMPLYGDDVDAFREETQAIHAGYLSQTQEQIEAGAEIVVWPELAGIGVEEDVALLLGEAQSMAADAGIYLVAPTFTLYPDEEGRPAENRLLLISPEGEVQIDHVKFGGNLLEGSLPGDRTVQTIMTPFGTVSGIICWDSDYPAIISQAGRSGVDVMFVPSHDWQAIDRIHSEMAVYRAIENGYVLVRQAEQGESIITDPYGRVIASMNHFDADERLMRAAIPTTGVGTIYSQIGDLFGLVVSLGFVVITIWSIISWLRGRRATVSAEDMSLRPVTES